MVVEIVRPSTASKYLFALVILKARIMSTVATTPDSTFIPAGVPNRAENLPRTLGPPPSTDAIASVRSAPMIHVVPALARAKTKMTAVSRPSSSPPPVRSPSR